MMVQIMTEPTARPSPDLIQANTVNTAPWERYRRPYVRDLAYVLACPTVLTKWVDFAPHELTQAVTVHHSSFWHMQYEAYRARLIELENTSAYQELTRYLLARPSPNRLGFHFEGLLSFWLEDGFAKKLHPYEILASNVQLFRGKQTAGELDLVLYNHQDSRTEHWELAIKFFMGSAPFEPINWVGINSRDNLQRKMTHMQIKQFCALRVDTKDHGQVKIDKRFAVIKGRFFLPMNCADFHYPDWLEPEFPMHRWLAASNNQGDNGNDNQYRDNQHTQHECLAERLSDVTAFRRAHYIEWFTQRRFYNKNDNIIKAAPALATLQQGLYFVKSTAQPSFNQHNTPYPNSYADYEPVVILRTDAHTGQTK